MGIENVLEQFGRQFRPISPTTLTWIKAIGDLTADPTYTPKRVRELGAL